MLPSASKEEPCTACESVGTKTWKCVPCDAHFCDSCWTKQVSHRPRRYGPSHEKVDTRVFNRLNKHFDYNQFAFQVSDHGQQAELHRNDVDTTWFSVVKQGARRDSCPQLQSTNRLVDIMADSDTGAHPDRYPQLVSFVGQTGAGKSTLIKMLMDQQRDLQTDQNAEESLAFQTPVSGVPGDCVPTTGDVHLYSDPFTNQSDRPILYADCEGMAGGERAPRGLQAIIEKAPDEARALQMMLTLKWATDPEKQTRQFSVANLFPRILYTFSDVIVFVVREIKTFESEILQLLVEWASVAVEKSINHPGFPHVIIAINACDTFHANLDTEKLLDEYRDSYSNAPKLQAIVDNLRQSGKHVSSTKELLARYYSSVQVVHIPSASHQRYMELDRRTLDLYNNIREKCSLSFSKKRAARLELNTQRMVRFMTSAYDHFSHHLDKPFNFVDEALHHNPMPRGFEGHVLNLILAVYMPDSVVEGSHTSESGPLSGILDTLSPHIASCVMLAAARGDYKCSYNKILQHNFRDAIKNAFKEFVSRWLRCGFQRGDQVCCLVKSSHRDYHQGKNGRYLYDGQYSHRFNQDETFNSWMLSIEQHIDNLKRQLNQSGADRVEIEIVWPSHCNQIYNFYKKYPSLHKVIIHATCLCCLNKIPDHPLPCGHVLCTDCVLALGDKARDGRVELRSCPLHPARMVWRMEETPVRIRFKPKDAGTRILCLDGGGVRGIVELVILQALEEQLCNFIPIRNFFDLIVGTSAGGIISLGLGLNNWSVDECIEMFKTLCKDAFERVPSLWRWKKGALIFSSSYYKTKPLEAALQSIFDKDSLLFGPRSDGGTPFVRVAVTTTTALGNDAAVFTNYNGDSSEHNYRFLREQDPSTEAKVWEVARATSASPPYYKPFRQGTGDTYIDGGVKHNCPIRIAYNEQRLIWRDTEDPPDVLLSIGTGLESNPPQSTESGSTTASQKTTGIRYLWKVASRMIDNQLDTEAIWRDYQELISPRHGTEDVEDRRRQMRLNVEFPTGESRPELDDKGKLKVLENQARKACKNNGDIKEAAHRLVASCFYFEVTRSCRDLDHIHTAVYGAIKCRFEEGSDIKGLGKFLENCVKPFQNFRPYFLLENGYLPRSAEDHDLVSGSVIPIPPSTLEDMKNYGTFHMPFDSIRIHRDSISRPTRLSIRLQKDNYHHYNGRNPYYGSKAGQSLPYLSIGGFPRVLLAPEKNNEHPITPHLSKSRLQSHQDPQVSWSSFTTAPWRSESALSSPRAPTPVRGPDWQFSGTDSRNSFAPETPGRESIMSEGTSFTDASSPTSLSTSLTPWSSLGGRGGTENESESRESETRRGYFLPEVGESWRNTSSNRRPSQPVSREAGRVAACDLDLDDASIEDDGVRFLEAQMKKAGF